MGIEQIPGMPIDTMGCSGSLSTWPSPTHEVFALCDGLDVIGVGTPTYPAEMVKLSTNWDWSSATLIGESMGIDRTIVDAKTPIAIRREAACP